MMIETETNGKVSSATRGTYLRLRSMILTGEFPAGEKLKIEQLRSLLQVGASPVREALSLLTSDMLVERIDQRGFRAAPMSKANFNEILMLRCVLEDMALRASIQNADGDWEERLVLSHHRMNKARTQGVDIFEEYHKNFHMMLLDNCGQPTLLRYCAQLYDLNIRYRFLASGDAGYHSRDIEAEHQAILEAALNTDADRASAELLSHYKLTGEYLSRQIAE